MRKKLIYMTMRKKFIQTTITGYLNENYKLSSYITLNELYDGEYPDQNELIWEYVTHNDFNDVKFKIIEINVNEYFDKFKDEIKHISSEQKRIIKKYQDNINNIKDSIIVVNSYDHLIIDGYHRLAAFYLSGIEKIKALDLSEEL